MTIDEIERKLRARCQATLADPDATDAKRLDARAALLVLGGVESSTAVAYAALSDEQRSVLARVSAASASPSAACALTHGTGMECGIFDPAAVKARLAQMGGAR